MRKGTISRLSRILKSLYLWNHIAVRVSSCRGGGEASPSKHPASKKKREKGERERERERKKEREVHGGGRGACIFLHRIASDQYSLLLHDSIM